MSVRQTSELQMKGSCCQHIKRLLKKGKLKGGNPYLLDGDNIHCKYCSNADKQFIFVKYSLHTLKC